MKRRRLILVSPHFPPTNAPDHQRVRLSLSYWRELGWDPEVIAVESEQVAAPHDPFLSAIIPEEIPIERVSALSLFWSRIPGFGTLGYRARGAIRRALISALERDPNPEDVFVYFSTTQFPVHSIIPELRRRWPNLAIAIDYQDPWVSDFYGKHPEIKPPGGRLKFKLVQSIARRQEPRILREVAGITTVSTRYRTEICARNPWFESKPWLEIPFGGAASDFDSLEKLAPVQTQFDQNDGFRHWVYVGRGGQDMEHAVRALFRALYRIRKVNASYHDIRMHFLGTDYAPPGRGHQTIRPIAEEEGVGAWVHENPERLPYGETLRCLKDAHALIIPGSMDPNYSASKLYPCILSKRPLLAIFHTQSPVHAILQSTTGGKAVAFTENCSVDETTEQILQGWFNNHSNQNVPSTNWTAFNQFSDRTMTRRLAQFFESISR